MRAEEVFAFGGIFRPLRSINRNPADPLDVCLCPAVIAAYLAHPPVGGQREPDSETRRNTQRAAIADENGMKIRAVTSPRITGVVDVSATPALPALVVLHCRDYV